MSVPKAVDLHIRQIGSGQVNLCSKQGGEASHPGDATCPACNEIFFWAEGHEHKVVVEKDIGGRTWATAEKRIYRRPDKSIYSWVDLVFYGRDRAERARLAAAEISAENPDRNYRVVEYEITVLDHYSMGEKG
jgi:hypothetical protein